MTQKPPPTRSPLDRSTIERVAGRSPVLPSDNVQDSATNPAASNQPPADASAAQAPVLDRTIQAAAPKKRVEPDVRVRLSKQEKAEFGQLTRRLAADLDVSRLHESVLARCLFRVWLRYGPAGMQRTPPPSHLQLPPSNDAEAMEAFEREVFAYVVACLRKVMAER